MKRAKKRLGDKETSSGTGEWPGNEQKKKKKKKIETPRVVSGRRRPYASYAPELCTSSLVTPLSKSEEISCMQVYAKQQELLKVHVVRLLDKRREMFNEHNTHNGTRTFQLCHNQTLLTVDSKRKEEIERERGREREGGGERERERERQTDRQTDREGGRERGGEKGRESSKDTVQAITYTNWLD